MVHTDDDLVKQLEATVVALLGLSEEKLESHFLRHFVDHKIRERTEQRFKLLRARDERGRYTYVDKTLHRTIGFATMNGHFPVTEGSGSIHPVSKGETGALDEFYVDTSVHIRFDLLLLRKALAEAGEQLDEREVGVGEQDTLKEDRRILRRGTPRRASRPDAPPEDEAKHVRIHDRHRFAKERQTHIGRFTFRQYKYCPRFLAKCALLLFRQVCPSPARLDAYRGNRQLRDDQAVRLTFEVIPDTALLVEPWMSDGNATTPKWWVGYAQLPRVELVLAHPPKQVGDESAQYILETSAYTADIGELMVQIDRLVRQAFLVALTSTHAGHALKQKYSQRQKSGSTLFRHIKSTVRANPPLDQEAGRVFVGGAVYRVRDVGGSLGAALVAIGPPDFKSNDEADDEHELGRFSDVTKSRTCVLARHDEDYEDTDGVLKVRTALMLDACFEAGRKLQACGSPSQCTSFVVRRTNWSGQPYYDALVKTNSLQPASSRTPVAAIEEEDNDDAVLEQDIAAAIEDDDQQQGSAGEPAGAGVARLGDPNDSQRQDGAGVPNPSNPPRQQQQQTDILQHQWRLADTFSNDVIAGLLNIN